MDRAEAPPSSPLLCSPAHHHDKDDDDEEEAHDEKPVDWIRLEMVFHTTSPVGGVEECNVRSRRKKVYPDS